MMTKESQKVSSSNHYIPITRKTHIFYLKSHHIPSYDWGIKKLQLSQQPFLHIPINIPYHSFHLNYPSKSNQTNLRSSTPSFTPHPISHISSLLSLNPNFIKSPSRDQYIIKTRERHHIPSS